MQYDIIIIGAGHAGCEAALAGARMGCTTLLLTINLDAIAQMSCNPAIGGLAKGHLVREIDALGGEMAKCIDQTGIQFKMLNKSKGPAVWSLRAQADKQTYRIYMKNALEKQPGLSIKQAMVEEIVCNNQVVEGVRTQTGEFFSAKTVVLTPGTFLNGLIHIGLTSYPAGRAGEFPSEKISQNLKNLGFSLGRLKTGTPPRLDGKTIDFSQLKVHAGDTSPLPFSYSTSKITQEQIPCYITHTNEKTHQIILENLSRSPLYGGVIKGIGPRYCPSIEDKVVRFKEKISHQVFLEPEGKQTEEIYANGVSTSLPIDVQLNFLRTIKGLENVEIMRPGYAIEYDFADPSQLFPSLETKLIKGLYFAGQINGTSGYEEAAAQGLLAGINAALNIKKKEPLIIDRSQGYIGVLIDDLVTMGTKEPYRMFTSRAEYRLLLRHDNADMRLRVLGYQIGLVSQADYDKFLQKKKSILELIDLLKTTMINPSAETNTKLAQMNLSPINQSTTLSQVLRRPEVSFDQVISFYSSPDMPMESREIIEQAEIEIKYEGYIKRQIEQVMRFKQWEEKKIPPEINYEDVPGLSSEVREKLNKIKPFTIGQAKRISGITPAAIAILCIYLEKLRRNFF